MLNYSKLTRELRAHHYIIQNKCYKYHDRHINKDVYVDKYEISDPKSSASCNIYIDSKRDQITDIDFDKSEHTQTDYAYAGNFSTRLINTRDVIAMSKLLNLLAKYMPN